MTQTPHRVPVKKQIYTLAPCTSLIDAEWDVQPVSCLTHRSGPHRIDATAPRTSLIDAEWDLPLIDGGNGQPTAHQIHIRPPQLALVDVEEELDPVVTYFELDGPECLGLSDSELDCAVC